MLMPPPARGDPCPIARQTSYGLDGGIGWSVVNGMSLYVSGEYLHARLRNDLPINGDVLPASSPALSARSRLAGTPAPTPMRLAVDGYEPEQLQPRRRIWRERRHTANRRSGSQWTSSTSACSFFYIKGLMLTAGLYAAITAPAVMGCIRRRGTKSSADEAPGGRRDGAKAPAFWSASEPSGS